ncbi:MAG TPA: copper resistance system multicopper oxidase [Aquifex aeolicus]|uniref:Copper resistance system multicopper oxidase n=1 Tax=Aquifex aeolicus TaxID=63363 RepID=A0A7C5L3G5_AQUAO|nr:copper resistance system multicopper oxidase [Aquifex aeolicus]
MISRREFLMATLSAGALYGSGALSRVFASGSSPAGKGIELAEVIRRGGRARYEFVVRRQPVGFDGRMGKGITLNGSLPGPLLRLQEGEEAELVIYNELEEVTSIHWHGILLPYEMDGVPGVTFPGIKPGEKFTARFRLKQSGTYWYHSHAGLQEQLGHYGPMIVDPADPDPVPYDREYVVVLSDWTFEDPEWVMSRLKKEEGYFNYNKRTVFDFFEDVRRAGFLKALRERMMWGRMRMSPRDIADVTGATYIFLMNGHTTEENWTALFRLGERVRLRFINASAMTYYDVRMPGLRMKVVQADGQNVQPVEVDELRIAVAETYDVVVQPTDPVAYPIFAEAMDRSGFVRGTLAPEEGMVAPIPPRRKPQERKMAFHRKGHGDTCGACDPQLVPYDFGPTAAMVVRNPVCRLEDPGVGLQGAEHRVLTYADLKSYEPWRELFRREPDRVMEIHLTGNMERFLWRMWAKEGNRWTSEPTELIRWRYGELVRMIWVNHTMMDHPIHLHGLWMYLRNGSGEFNPRKHTLNIKPGEKLCVDVLVDAPGYWAFHCHLFYHMHAGMIRVVEVT